MTFDSNGGEITYPPLFGKTQSVTAYTVSTSPFFKDTMPSTAISIDHRWWASTGESASFDGITQTNDRGTLIAPSGKTLVGWNTKADGTGASYAIGDPIPCTTDGGSMTLYAQYSTKKSFKGWNTAPDGSGTSYQPGDALPDSNLDLYAQWK